MTTTKKVVSTWFALVKIRSADRVVVYSAATRGELEGKINQDDEVENVLDIIRGQSFPVKKAFVIG